MKYNFIWVMIDSVRRYHTKGDDRSRLDFMDEFATEGVEFLNCVTSAPSTLMSISAILTSMPSYYLGRNYNDFQFDTDYFNSLTKILKNNGYNTNRAFIMHPEVRLKLKQFDLVPKKLWPNHLSHNDWFSNDNINEMVHKVLNHEKGIKDKKPSFWFIDYNCRNDENISEIVSNTIRTFEKAGYNDKNTIFMISSDHGYPDPRRGITPETLRQKKLTHDVFMTDDNIMIPLILKFPGCKPGQKINYTISTLDIMPTILDLMSIEIPDKISDNFCGFSLVDLINGSNDKKFVNRKIRTDARWIDQPGRLTALRGDKYKYIYDHDNKKEEFVFIGDNDNQLIEKSVINSNDKEIISEISDFRKEFINSEIEAEKSFDKYNSYKLVKNIKLLSVNKILLIGFFSRNLLNQIISSLRKKYPKLVIDVLLIDDKFIVQPDDKFGYESITSENIINDGFINKNKSDYDIIVNIATNFSKDEKNIFNKINVKFSYSKKILLNTRSSNKIFNNPFKRKLNNFIDHLKVRFMNRKIFYDEPLLLMKEPTVLLRKILKKDLIINGGWKKYKYKHRIYE